MDTGVGSSRVLLAGFLECIYKYHEKEIVLNLACSREATGMASASSFVMMDKAIAKFEEEHPG